MTNCRNDERRLEILEARHVAADERFMDKMDRDYAKAERSGLVGEIIRDGKTVYYINLSDRNGRLTGKTKESASDYDLYKYLIRNRYV
jgi:hypothetical protein